MEEMDSKKAGTPQAGMRDGLLTFFKGMFVGGTMLVPGVSGGSMAIILGVYDRLVSSVSSFFKHKRESFLFLLTFALGGGIGMLLFANPLLSLIGMWRRPMLYFFLGAVIGSIPMICREAKIKRFDWRQPLYVVIGILIVLAIGLLPSDMAANSEMQAGVVSFLWLLAAGFIAAVALVLPGISVSYMLLMMGLYDETMRAITELYFPFLIPLGLGLVLGIILTTRILERAMERHPQGTYLIILGFMLGSVPELFPGLPSGLDWLFCPVMLAAGFMVIWLLSRMEAKSGGEKPAEAAAKTE